MVVVHEEHGKGQGRVLIFFPPSPFPLPEFILPSLANWLHFLLPPSLPFILCFENQRWQLQEIIRARLKYRISSNNCHLSNNRPPLTKILKIIAPPPPPSSSSLPFISSLSSCSAMRFSKTDRWQFKLGKLINELKFGTLKKPMFSFFDGIFFFRK